MRYTLVKIDYTTGETTQLLPGQTFPKTTALRKCKTEAKKLETRKRRLCHLSNGFSIGVPGNDPVYGIHICEEISQ